MARTGARRCKSGARRRTQGGNDKADYSLAIPGKGVLIFRRQKFFVCELNAGMMVEDVKLSVKNKDDVSFFGKVGGDLASPEEIYESLRKQYGF